jgi:hypothetical protein
MANLIAKSLYVGNETASNVYTVSNTTGSYAIIKSINICNTSNASVTFDMHLLTESGTVGNNNALFKSFTVNSYETINVDSAIVLNAGNKIHIVNANNRCTFSISGAEYSA